MEPVSPFVELAPITWTGVTYKNPQEASKASGLSAEYIATLAKRVSYSTYGLFTTSAYPDIGAVYVITNTISGLRYIGSCSNIKSRINAHTNTLIRGTHQNPKMQADYNLYGPESFTYTYEFYPTRQAAFDNEQLLLDEANPDLIYNTSKDVRATGSRFEPVRYAMSGDKPKAARRPETNRPGVFMLLHMPTNKVVCYSGSRVKGKLSNLLNRYRRGDSELTNALGIIGPIPDDDIVCLEIVECPPKQYMQEAALLYTKALGRYEPVGNWVGLGSAGIFKKYDGDLFEIVALKSNMELTRVDLVKCRYELLHKQSGIKGLSVVLSSFRQLLSADPDNVHFKGYPPGHYIAVAHTDLGEKLYSLTDLEIEPFVNSHSKSCKVSVYYGENSEAVSEKFYQVWKAQRVEWKIDYSSSEATALAKVLEARRVSEITYESDIRSKRAKESIAVLGVREHYDNRGREIMWMGVRYKNFATLNKDVGVKSHTVSRYCNDPNKTDCYYL